MTRAVFFPKTPQTHHDFFTPRKHHAVTEWEDQFSLFTKQLQAIPGMPPVDLNQSYLLLRHSGKNIISIQYSFSVMQIRTLTLKQAPSLTELLRTTIVTNFQELPSWPFCILEMGHFLVKIKYFDTSFFWNRLKIKSIIKVIGESIQVSIGHSF